MIFITITEGIKQWLLTLKRLKNYVKKRAQGCSIAKSAGGSRRRSDEGDRAASRKGLAAAANKAGRIATEGVVESYIHAGGRIGVLVEINCETDFVAKTDQFKDFARDIAMHIAAMSPRYVRREEVPQEEIEKEKEILKAQALNEGKPEKIVEKMVEGRIGKYFEEFCLLEQAFVKDPDKAIAQLVNEKINRDRRKHFHPPLRSL